MIEPRSIRAYHSENETERLARAYDELLERYTKLKTNYDWVCHRERYLQRIVRFKLAFPDLNITQRIILALLVPTVLLIATMGYIAAHDYYWDDWAATWLPWMITTVSTGFFEFWLFQPKAK